MLLKKLLFLSCVVILTACGFQLRGTADLPAVLQRMAIQPDNPYLPLQRQIRALLHVNAVKIVEVTQNPTAILQITAQDFTVQDTSVGADGRIREKSYTYLVTFTVTNNQGEKLMGPETIRSERIVEFDPNAALSQSLEEKTIQQETLQDIANQLVRRLSFLPNPPSTQ